MNEDKRLEFGRYIREARQKRGLSKFKASKALGYKTDGVINQVEQGKCPIPIDKIHPYARVLNIDPQELLDKIQECEPELFVKYLRLEKDIIEHFSARVMGRSNRVSAMGGQHHFSFPDPETLSLHNAGYHAVPSIYYRNLEEQEEQLELPFGIEDAHKQGKLFDLRAYAERKRASILHHRGSAESNVLWFAA